jgi:hypothetical protein
MMTKARLVRFVVPVGVSTIVAVLTLLLLYSEPLRRAILEPVTWIVNDIQQSLSTLPQALLWTIGLLIGSFVLVVSWKRVLGGSSSRSDHRRWAVVKPSNKNAIESLARDLDRSRRRHVSRVRVVRELSILAIRLIAQREGLSLEEARNLLNSGQWPDDPRVRQFFASRRDGQRGVPKQSFLEAVAYTLAHLERYHQEV